MEIKFSNLSTIKDSLNGSIRAALISNGWYTFIYANIALYTLYMTLAMLRYFQVI